MGRYSGAYDPDDITKEREEEDTVFSEEEKAKMLDDLEAEDLKLRTIEADLNRQLTEAKEKATSAPNMKWRITANRLQEQLKRNQAHRKPVSDRIQDLRKEVQPKARWDISKPQPEKGEKKMSQPQPKEPPASAGEDDLIKQADELSKEFERKTAEKAPDAEVKGAKKAFFDVFNRLSPKAKDEVSARHNERAKGRQDRPREREERHERERPPDRDLPPSLAPAVTPEVIEKIAKIPDSDEKATEVLNLGVNLLKKQAENMAALQNIPKTKVDLEDSERNALGSAKNQADSNRTVLHTKIAERHQKRTAKVEAEHRKQEFNRRKAEMTPKEWADYLSTERQRLDDEKDRVNRTREEEFRKMKAEKERQDQATFEANRKLAEEKELQRDLRDAAARQEALLKLAQKEETLKGTKVSKVKLKERHKLKEEIKKVEKEQRALKRDLIEKDRERREKQNPFKI